ncbi:DUF4192 domain-containing protein [Streptomyces griseoviridis]|uniref:DUF4192 domain-containing protein n=1 Tax=Streptomyces griseoviridis TaxID=45398 RepID=A0A918GPG8_STRGD|nr:DUF4192 domain-containing protein [Streptomyces niveoruber]GGS51501.1 hypothetical protein GCM10010238_46300 [Streptomyces niveoruber]
MTNHNGPTGPSENGDISGRERSDHSVRQPHDDASPITLRTPAELADALPYLLGYRPEDSIVLVALTERDGRGRFGGRARLGIPPHEDDWGAAARQLVHGLVTGSTRRGARPGQMVVYLCQEPGDGETGRQVMNRLRALAQRVRVECGALDVPVVEALCISDGRFWSYCCDQPCCPAEGTPMGLPGTSVLAAAATYAGIQVRGTLRDLHARLRPMEGSTARAQEAALDAASMTLVSRILHDGSRAEVAEETLGLAERIMERLAGAPTVTGVVRADLRDDELLAHDEAARLILGLQDRTTRDRAAEWMEGDAAPRALRLWRALARRCTGSYGEYAAAPLTLAGWVAWSTGDELEAREALAMALAADPDYLFARLLHQACNEGLDPETIRTCLRGERTGRQPSGTTGTPTGEDAGQGSDRTPVRREAGTGPAGHEAAADETHSRAPDPLPDESSSVSVTSTTARRPTPACTTGTLSGTRRRPRTRGREAGAARTRPRTPGAGTRPAPASSDRTRRSHLGRRETGTGPDLRTGERDSGGGEAANAE